VLNDERQPLRGMSHAFLSRPEAYPDRTRKVERYRDAYVVGVPDGFPCLETKETCSPRLSGFHHAGGAANGFGTRGDPLRIWCWRELTGSPPLLQVFPCGVCGASSTFYVGACFATLALTGLLLARR